MLLEVSPPIFGGDVGNEEVTEMCEDIFTVSTGAMQTLLKTLVELITVAFEVQRGLSFDWTVAAAALGDVTLKLCLGAVLGEIIFVRSLRVTVLGEHTLKPLGSLILVF